jgi:hypothetical protein
VPLKRWKLNKGCFHFLNCTLIAYIFACAIDLSLELTRNLVIYASSSHEMSVMRY